MRLTRAVPWAAGVVLVVLAALAFWWVHGPLRPPVPSRGGAREPSSVTQAPEKPSIAVLPFLNMSEDHAQEYFSDGITEDLITDLSKLSGLL